MRHALSTCSMSIFLDNYKDVRATSVVNWLVGCRYSATLKLPSYSGDAGLGSRSKMRGQTILCSQIFPLSLILNNGGAIPSGNLLHSYGKSPFE